MNSLVVLGGTDLELAILSVWLQSADRVYAADSGADRCIEAGRIPDVTIGDLDSLSAKTRELLPDLRHDGSDSASDCDKVLELALNDGVKSVTVAGAEGDALAHVIGNLSSVVRSPLECQLVLRSGLGVVLKGPSTTYRALHPGQKTSLLPLIPCEDVDFLGVRWEMRQVKLSLAGSISLSNLAIEDKVTVHLERGAALWVIEQNEDERLHPWWPH
jgi:thiamine pyrophosphokinase